MYEYKVKEVVSIYDGDTMKVVVDVGFGIYSEQTLRFYGINAPEMKGDSKNSGTVVRDWLRNKIQTAQSNNRDIIIKTRKDKIEKFGRMLAEVFIEGESVSLNEQMVSQKLAVSFMKDD